MISMISRLLLSSRSEANLCESFSHDGENERKIKSLRLATTHEPGIQAAGPNGVLLADPRDESLKA
jgi:hypothetical protein